MRAQWSHRVGSLMVAVAAIAIGAAVIGATTPARSLSHTASSKTRSIRVRNAYGDLPLSFGEKSEPDRSAGSASPLR